MMLPQHKIFDIACWNEEVQAEESNCVAEDRQPLLLISSNRVNGKYKANAKANASPCPRLTPPQACKRRHQETDTSRSQDQILGQDIKRRRGRPPKVQKEAADEREITHISNPMVFAHAPESVSSGQTSSLRSLSPKKRNIKSFGQARGNAAIDTTFLESCSPRVVFRTSTVARQQGTLPAPVIDLYKIVNPPRAGFIPSKLQVSSPFLKLLSTSLSRVRKVSTRKTTTHLENHAIL